MEFAELAVPGAFVFTPRQFADDRGTFCETFTERDFTAATGASFAVAQMNLSVSMRGVVRGIHYADVPPGQAKYVMCQFGRVLDVIVDLRVGSPTFGEHATVVLDDSDRRAVYLPVGVGHGFCALTDQAVVSYAVSSAYDPGREHSVNPLDPALGLPWPDLDLILSPRDAQAPTLAEAERDGRLPVWTSN
jgi:dTDP-4-dehydrorhamnose 3,5-epimerase